MEKLALFWLEIRRTSWRLLCFLLLVVTLFVALPNMSNPAPLWSDALKAILLSLSVTGAMLAGISAWVAIREKQSGIRELLMTTALPASQRWAISWLAMVFLALCLLTILFVGVWIWLNWRGAWQEAIFTLMFDSFLASMTYVSIGFLVGLWLPTRFTPLFAAVCTFGMTPLLLILPQVFPKAFASFPGLSNLSPVVASYEWYYSPLVSVNSYLLHSHLLWLVALTSSCLFLILLREKWDLKRGIGALSSALFTIMMMFVLLNIPPNQQSNVYTPYQPLCHQETIEICIHPAYASLLPDVADLIQRLLMPLAEVRESPKRAEQHDGIISNGKMLPNNVLYLPDGTLAFSLVNYNRAGEQDAFLAWELAWAVVQEQNEVGAHSLTEAQAVVATWLVQQAGYSLIQPYSLISAEGQKSAQDFSFQERERLIEEAALRFSQLPRDVREQWLKANFRTLRRSTLTLDDLP